MAALAFGAGRHARRPGHLVGGAANWGAMLIHDCLIQLIPAVVISIGDRAWYREHSGSAAKAALNDCPHDRREKGAHLAAFVSCIPLLYGRAPSSLGVPMVRAGPRPLVTEVVPRGCRWKREGRAAVDMMLEDGGASSDRRPTLLMGRTNAFHAGAV